MDDPLDDTTLDYIIARRDLQMRQHRPAAQENNTFVDLLLHEVRRLRALCATLTEEVEGQSPSVLARIGEDGERPYRSACEG